MRRAGGATSDSSALAEMTADEVLGYLVVRGLLPAGATGTVGVLPGGVSGDVLTVESDGLRLVLKQFLPRLKVAQVWTADPMRILVEAAGLRLAGSLVADSVPVVLDVDPAHATITMVHAPDSFTPWKARLLAGQIEPTIARRVGELLAAWHSRTYLDDDLLRPFDDTTGFVTLRIEPFYLVTSEQHPSVRETLHRLAERLLQSRSCLVHGDFSPKNILTDGHRVWVLDWEVAHRGNPVFDLAFLLSHLLAKAVHRPSSAAGYRQCAEAFMAAYVAAAREELRAPDAPNLCQQIAALLLARVDGASPAAYFSETERRRARDLALSVLSDGSPPTFELWNLI